MALCMRAETVFLPGPPVPQPREGPQAVPQNTKGGGVDTSAQDSWPGQDRAEPRNADCDVAGGWGGGQGTEALEGVSTKWGRTLLS